MLKTLTIIFLCTCSFANSQSFKEREVMVTPEVAGKLVTPENQSPEQAVLILHGFNDHMDGVGNLQKQLAHTLAEEGIGSLRINFRGEGERNDNVITSTLDSRKKDGEDAYKFLKKQFPNASYAVTGWSMGGSTTILLLGSHPEWFNTAVLWSSAGHNLRDNIGASGTPEHSAMIKKVLLEGKAEFQSWTTITYTRVNYASWIGFDSADYLPKYHGAFLGIRGTNDFLPLHEPEWMKILPGKKKAYHVLGDADHIFNVLDPPNSQGDEVVQLTVDWFKNTLK
jgi:pimeloyl-ACP methyl ester carboxylesterase